MKKKFLFLFLMLVAVFCVGTLLSACGSNNTAKIEKIDNATINGNEIFMYVSSDTDEVSLADKIKCNKNSIWKLYYDNIGQTEIPTKIATGKYGNLADGDNVFYIVVNSQDGSKTNTYQLTIHRSYAIQVYYYDSYSLLKTDYVYTGKEYAVDYVPNLIGYTFNGWKTSSGEDATTIIPWETTYFYISKTADVFTTTLDVNGGNKLETDTYQLLYGESATLPVPTKDHYDFLGWYVGDYQFTNPLGSIICDWSIEQPYILTAKWALQQQTVTLKNAIGNAGTLIGDGKYDYNSSVEINAIPQNGYSFKGWYNDNVLVTTEARYKISLVDDITLTAQWEFFTVSTTTNNENGGIYTNFSNDKITYGETVSLVAHSNLGYTWMGWYNSNNDLVCKDFEFAFEMPKTDVAYVAKWEVKEEMVNFNFDSTVNSCNIVNIINKNVVSIVIPDYVTNIERGAFNGCSVLENITLPFVGGTYNSSSASEKTLFGYIFGNIPFDGAIATTQKYSSYDGAKVVCYIPQSLKTVIVTGGNNLFYGAFYNCANIKNITLPDNISKIANNTFYRCESLVSIIIPQSVTYVGAFAFSYCKCLTAITFEDTDNWIKSNSALGNHGNSNIDVSNPQNNVTLFVGDYNATTIIGFYLLKNYSF